MTVAAPEATLATILAFCRAYEEGSFTRAARVLHVRPAAVSRAVARLEATLAAPLFRRSTRQMKATAEGTAYYARCREALSLLATAESAVKEEGGVPRGRVRLSVGTTYGLHRLLPRLGELGARFPEISLDVQVSNHSVDFVREGFDLAIRLGAIDDASLVARKLGEASLGVFASKGYLARRGRPKTVLALTDHVTIPFMLPRTGRVLPWVFASPNRTLVPAANIRCLDDPQGLIAMARGDAGLVQIYHFMVRGELGRGELVEVLERHAGRTRPFSLVYPKAKVSLATRAVIDLILAIKLS